MAIYQITYNFSDAYGRQRDLQLKVECTDDAQVVAFAVTLRDALLGMSNALINYYDIELPAAAVQGTPNAGSNVDEELKLLALSDEGSKVVLSIPCPNKENLGLGGGLVLDTQTEAAIEALIDNVLVSDGESILRILSGQLARD